MTLPAVASAQVTNDNYASPIVLNARGSTLPKTGGRPNDTIAGATTESNENTLCVRPGFASVSYDSTVWYDIYPHRPGNLRLVADAATFGAVVGVMPFEPGSRIPNVSAFRCGVASLGTAILDYPFRLQEGVGYAIQVGGYNGVQGNFSLSVLFDPDTDRDGLVDSLDSCPSESGASATRGCPDTDRDGVINRFDRCPAQSGTAAHSGCPDRDRDGTIDPDDACPRESTHGKRDRNDNGCPDRELLKPETKLTAGSFCTGSICHGIRVKKLVVSEVPRGTRVKVSCTKHACKKASKRTRKSRRVRFFSGQALNAGVGLTITVSRKGFVGRRVTYWIQPNDFKKTKLDCLKSGKPVRCTRRLLVR